MQFYYGNQMPLRILDEAEFWKNQEAEHTVVIRELLPNLEPNYVTKLKEWELEFQKIHQYLIRYITSVNRLKDQLPPKLFQDVIQITSVSLLQSEEFIKFLRNMMAQSKVISGNVTAKVVLNHIIRESEYFIGIAQTILYNR